MRLRIFLFSLVTVGLSASLKPENALSKIFGNLNNMYGTDTLINNQGIKVESFNLEIVPPSTGIQFYKDGIVFLSSSKASEKMLPGQISFGKIDASYAILKDTILERPVSFSNSTQFPYPAEAFSFSTDYQTMYFSRYSRNEGVEKIYLSKYSPGSTDQGDWSMDENPLNFCTGQSTYTQPALSADGKILIFASNRPGSAGGMDLFISQNKNGTWSEPDNLGNTINTTSNELYPFLDSENNLYFSSDGLPGFGGFDIFVCKFTGNTWEIPVNLTGSINTRYDDIAFRINRKNEKLAFFSVNQKTGIRPIQLYKVTLNKIAGQENISTLTQFFTNPSAPRVFFLVREPAVEATNRAGTDLKSIAPRGKEDVVVYRVQFLTSFNPKTRSLITLNGKDYSIFEYLYSGAYRLCVGEFSALSQAKELQNILIQNDYPQAFIVAFKNNVISLDPDLFKEQPGASASTEKKVVSEPVAQVKPPETRPEVITKEIPVAETKKAEPEKAAVTKTATDKPAVTKTEPSKTVSQAPETNKPGPVKPAITESEANKDNVVYRVQILTNSTSKGTYKITINNKAYNTYEYKYSGAYRICVGEFSTLTPAKELQNLCRKSGHPQAFVVAFKNNVRTTDPALFK